MTTMQNAIQDLKSALAGLESGEGPEPFLEGHGLQSRRFRFEWRDETLSIDFDLPWGRLLADEDAQRDDTAEIDAACRMAILLLVAREGETLLREGEARILVSCGENGTHYGIIDADGETVDEGNDWGVLASRLESAFEDGAGNGIFLIWP